jgi:predicted PurR-regulated permease PerM
MNNPADDTVESTLTLGDHSAGTPESVFWLRVGGLALAAVMTYLVWRIVTPLWQPLLWATLLGGLLSPWNQKLSRRLGDRPRLASCVTSALTIALFLVPIGFVGGAVAAQSAQLLARLEGRVHGATEVASMDLTQLPWLQKPLAWIGQYTSITLEQLQGWMITGVRHLLQILMSSGGTVVLGAVGTAISFLLMIFVLFFVLRDGPVFAQKFVALLPMEERRRSRMWQHLADVTRGVFMGIGLTAVVQGILVGVGFWIAGLPSPLVFGVMSIFFALVPVVGTWIIWVPGVIFLLTQGDYGHAVFLALWGALIVGMIDNFLRPILISGRAEVPTLAVFVGVMGGLAAFGFIGLFLGPIVLGLLVALFRFEYEELVGADTTG